MSNEGDASYGLTTWKWGTHVQGCDGREFQILCALTGPTYDKMTHVNLRLKALADRAASPRPLNAPFTVVKDNPAIPSGPSPFPICSLMLGYHGLMREANIDSLFRDEI
jgi:hypothetical protein